MSKATYDFQTSAKPETVYQAVSTAEGFAGWWCRTSTVDAKVGGEAEFRFYGGEAIMVFRFDKLEPNRLVEMTCIRTHNANPARQADKWQGTRLAFEVKPGDGGNTAVHLQHDGWAETVGEDVLAQIRQGWNHFGNSLQQYVETGKGMPYDDPPKP